jgi:probable selenium-dependent hydroxylase accessory protein YqeC
MAKNTAELLADQLPRYTSIIGGGGKTTLMLALGEELASRGHSVLITTTTHLAWPAPRKYGFLSPTSVEQLNRLSEPGKVIIAGYPAQNGRMTGLKENFLNQAEYDYILIEADGSARLPLKVHKETEPVIPSCTQLVIQVAGLSAIGKPAEESVHRYGLIGLYPGEAVTNQWVARILDRGWEASHWNGPALTVLNQADDPQLVEEGHKVLHFLRMRGVVCSLKNENAPKWEDSQ